MESERPEHQTDNIGIHREDVTGGDEAVLSFKCDSNDCPLDIDEAAGEDTFDLEANPTQVHFQLHNLEETTTMEPEPLQLDLESPDDLTLPAPA